MSKKHKRIRKQVKKYLISYIFPKDGKNIFGEIDFKSKGHNPAPDSDVVLNYLQMVFKVKKVVIVSISEIKLNKGSV